MTAAAALALAPDPALPGRDTLLDAGAMAERLAPLLRAEGPLERCRRVLVRYDPGKRLAVLYGIRAGGAEHRVVASAYADEARVPPGFAHDRELGAVLWTFPDDPRLGGLTSIADWSQTAGALLGRGGVRAQLARYVPEHRAVARCVDPGGATVAYAKVYRDGEGDRVARLQAALAGRLAGDPDLRIPRVLGFSRPRRLLVVEALDGQGLLAARGEALEDGLSRLGAGLARLHGLGPASGTAWSFGVRLRRRLEAMASAVGRMRPDARDAAGDLARALGALRPSAAEPLVLVHGDAALKNAVFDGRGVALVDLDDAKPGPAAADLGRVLSWIRAERVMGRLTDCDAQRLAGALLAGYGELREAPSPAALRWYTAATALQVRCRKAVTRLHPDYAGHLVALLRDAREALR
ncbi:MAG: aminoglycoside phosphotransferase family protein [Actinobacteria bacterium]|nr:MAG: aminoglycoside phosphotransferase family protein [Actinomycetota bacterium]